MIFPGLRSHNVDGITRQSLVSFILGVIEQLLSFLSVLGSGKATTCTGDCEYQ